MRHVSVDIETYSSLDLSGVGVYRYAESDDFRVLLLGYAVDDGDVEVCDLVHDDLPGEVRALLFDPDAAKHAFNASFERVCLSRLLGLPAHEYLPPEQWRCTMVQASYWGIPGSLRSVAQSLDLHERKDSAGTRLINAMSRPTADGSRPSWDGDDWHRFIEYNRQDVVVEREIQRAIGAPLPDAEQEAWCDDQRINDRGVAIDVTLAREGRAMATAAARAAKAELVELTGLDNPNSTVQLKRWLVAHGCKLESIGREQLERQLESDDIDPAARRAIELRLASAKSSVKKFDVAAQATCSDGRLRGCFQFYGAQTGRFAGRLVQLQNMPRGDLHDADLDGARELVRAGDEEGAELVYGDVSGVLKSLVRTLLVAPRGHLLAVCDYSAIEARVIAWLAGQRDVLAVFRTTGRIYEATAAAMYGCDESEVDHVMRQRGKVATLALGYGGGVGALERMGALKMGIVRDELPGIVSSWRGSHGRITALWRELEDAARAVCQGREPYVRCASGRLLVRREPACHGLAVELPSGRALHYRRMRVDGDGLSYLLSGRGAGLVQVRTYGGRLAENVTQAVARDLLVGALLRLERAGYEVVAHVHDEVLVEVDAEGAGDSLGEVRRIMCDAPGWADGLPLDADGYLCENYRKQ